MRQRVYHSLIRRESQFGPPAMSMHFVFIERFVCCLLILILIACRCKCPVPNPVNDYANYAVNLPLAKYNRLRDANKNR